MQKEGKKPFDIFKLGNTALDIVEIILTLFVVLIGFYSMYDSHLIKEGANDNSLKRFKPGYEGEEPDREIKGKMVAWLTIDDTPIDYPVMQGETNEEYLDKDPYGDYSLSGSIFLDSRNADDFSDPYSLIYGHHMSGDSMFGPLTRYMHESFFKKHQDGELIVGNDIYSIRFYTVLKVSVSEGIIFDPTEYAVSEIQKFIEDEAFILDKKEQKAGKGARLIALSTCRYPDTMDRTVVIGYLSDKPVSHISDQETERDLHAQA